MRLARAARAAVVTHACEGAPAEVCGVLAGRRAAPTPGEDRSASTAAGDDPVGNGEPRERDSDRITRTLRATNVADDPRSRYELDPAEQLRLMREVEAAGEDVVGFYHSHPAGPARPSATDERLATWDGYVYLLVSLSDDGPSVGAWRWTGRRFVDEPVEIGE